MHPDATIGRMRSYSYSTMHTATVDTTSCVIRAAANAGNAFPFPCSNSWNDHTGTSSAKRPQNISPAIAQCQTHATVSNTQSSVPGKYLHPATVGTAPPRAQTTNIAIPAPVRLRKASPNATIG